MPNILIILGVFLALAGIGSIAAGAPSWVLGLGLGSALIQSGAMGLVGGFLLVGIGFVLRALRDLSRKIDMASTGVAPMSARQATAPSASPPPAPRPVSRREPPPLNGREGSTREQSAREMARQPQPPLGGEDTDYFEPEDRNRPQRPETKLPLRQQPGPDRMRRPLERPLVAERSAPAPYEDEYDDEPPVAPVRGNSTGGSNTIVRSGIISGMAYTLYTDGSIEAELPIGTVRFASIEELQDHVSQTGEDADVDFAPGTTSRS